ncbi:UNVERIFIED_CONTAM: hypothetical protein Slati_3146900 [Sesamum latifolium]|uniref:Uncharacterized protein n=1 Tax=Sesamum latifolium TaxID=2727402 RepID=A0AAW2UUU5_9LAMI
MVTAAATAVAQIYPWATAVEVAQGQATAIAVAQRKSGRPRWRSPDQNLGDGCRRPEMLRATATASPPLYGAGGYSGGRGFVEVGGREGGGGGVGGGVKEGVLILLIILK